MFAKCQQPEGLTQFCRLIPGFSEPVLSYLQTTVGNKPCENECCLVIDAMSIRKDSSWYKNSGKFVGHVDFGGMMEEADTIATETLVFMAVGLSGRWKMPVAYFLLTMFQVKCRQI